MWVFFRGGFVSATVSPIQDGYTAEDPLIQVRGRCLEHVESFAHLGGVEPDKIIETPEADYAWRALMPRSKWTEAMAKISADVDYENFKSEASRWKRANDVPRWIGETWMNCLHNVWSVMYRLQSGERRRGVTGFMGDHHGY